MEAVRAGVSYPGPAGGQGRGRAVLIGVKPRSSLLSLGKTEEERKIEGSRGAMGACGGLEGADWSSGVQPGARWHHGGQTAMTSRSVSEPSGPPPRSRPDAIRRISVQPPLFSLSLSRGCGLGQLHASLQETGPWWGLHTPSSDNIQASREVNSHLSSQS
ncbi:hypothetical protein COCON_G00102100 [Conger conger]|uniref:Uncharacterized protein n=1 Tax=Conger conger TaxID=82655 RepID=A0A9Q1DHV0_CONCO|nr:hypothetical protein COCON_G00102100 [Conger conger]